MKLTKQVKTNILLAFFIAALIMANLLGAKITEFDLPNTLATIMNFIFLPIIYPLKLFLQSVGGREISLQFFNTIRVSVGILTVPLMFLITDIIEEVHGKKKAYEFIIIGVLTLLLVLVITSISVALPAGARSIDDATYASIFGVAIRITIASIIAFVIAQVHDMWSFAFWRKKTEGRFLWLRNNFSTIVSQLIDSTVFMFIAFYKTTPMWDAVFVISLIIPYWIFKILFAVLDTPLAYLGVWWMKKE